MEIKQIKIEDINPYLTNPRKNDKAVNAVLQSIQEFGFKVPIIVDKNSEIIAGHTRYKAAVKAGIGAVPCIIADDLTEEQVKAFRLADNKVSEFSEWDFDLLQDELKNILNIDMSEFGFNISDEIFKIEDSEEDIHFDISGPPKAQTGEVYQLGKHRVMCGDSTNIKDVQKLMGDQYADLLQTDPPYNVNYIGKTKERLKIQNDCMDDERFKSFLKDAFECAKAVLKKGAPFYIWHAESEGYTVRAALKEVDLQVRQCLIWKKNSFVLGRQDYQWIHEPCLYGWVEGESHKWYGDRKQSTVLEFDKPQKNEEHPTMKPVSLIQYQIMNSTQKHDIVLDLFGGSGTTLIACEQSGRKAYIMEKDPQYVDVIIKRYEEYTGKKQ